MRSLRLTVVSFLAAVLGALVAAFAPLGRMCSSVPGGGQETCASVSIFRNDGTWVLVVVAVPVLIALTPVLWHRRGVRIASAVLLWACSVVGMFSVGMFFVPAAILMTIAAVRHEPASVLVG